MGDITLKWLLTTDFIDALWKEFSCMATVGCIHTHGTFRGSQLKMAAMKTVEFA